MFLEIWRRASRFDPAKGSATAWILTLTHARAVDRVARRRRRPTARRRSRSSGPSATYDAVVEAGRVPPSSGGRCSAACGTLTELQRESITLAYYGGYTYREVAELLTARCPPSRPRLRDGLIRLRDCLGVTS